ncbi:MAG: helix-turn-helix domain-containing protein [Myxococcota bacterium]|nr:helix-turn-helix domain-containing protein [Myxococcota bacterium]
MPSPPPDELLTSRPACQRLGVRPQTLYAYVARKLIRSEQAGCEGRGRRYFPARVATPSGPKHGGATDRVEALVREGVGHIGPIDGVLSSADGAGLSSSDGNRAHHGARSANRQSPGRVNPPPGDEPK